MSDTAQEQSGFNLSNLFGLNAIGDMGAAFGLFSRALRGEEITAGDIPPGLQQQALHMAMTQVGVNPAQENAIEAFFQNETVIAQVREAIQADLAENVDTPQETILFQAIDGMSGEELQQLLVDNPDITGIITESQDFQDMLIEQTSGITVGQTLAAAGVPIEGLNADFLGSNISALGVEDLTSLDRAELDILIPALPQELFNSAFVENINGHLGSEQQIEAPSEDTYEARQQAYQTAKDNLIDHGPGGLTGFFNSVASLAGRGADMEEEFYNEINAAINDDTIAQFQATVEGQVHYQAQNFDFEEMEPEAIREFFDNNKDMIASQLTDQENWARIEEAINADLLIRNQERILENMLPEMTEEGISMFQQALNNLPPQLRELLNSLVDFAAEMLGNIGIDIGDFSPAPAADQAANDPAAEPDESEPVAEAAAIPIPGGR